MKITIITRRWINYDDVPQCDVFVGRTRDKAIESAVEIMEDWWQGFAEGDPSLASNDLIYREYVKFWEPEEAWDIQEQGI